MDTIQVNVKKNTKIQFGKYRLVISKEQKALSIFIDYPKQTQRF